MKFQPLLAAIVLTFGLWSSAHADWFMTSDKALLQLGSSLDVMGWGFDFDCEAGQLSADYATQTGEHTILTGATLEIVGNGGWRASFPVKFNGDIPGYDLAASDAPRLLALLRDGKPFAAYLHNKKSIQGKATFNSDGFDEVKNDVATFCMPPR